jgi:hypothetical protein
MALVTIHQPNFFPWLGYFDKIRQSDIFIFLDAVDYPRAGSGGMGSGVNRVRVAIQGEARWVTCPLRRFAMGLTRVGGMTENEATLECAADASCRLDD